MDSVCPTINDILTFLTHLYGKGKEYNTIAMTKSVLSSFIPVPRGGTISKHPLVKRLLKGVFNSIPPKAKYEYECIWDPQLLLTYLKSLNNQKIDFKMLSIKTVALLALSGQRVSTVHKFQIPVLQKTPGMVIFTFNDLLKHSRPNYRSTPIVFHSYPHDCSVCPVAVIESYFSARALLNTPPHLKSDQFILCYRNPHGRATTDTIARWVKMVLQNSGIDPKFSAHSC